LFPLIKYKLIILKVYFITLGKSSSMPYHLDKLELIWLLNSFLKNWSFVISFIELYKQFSKQSIDNLIISSINLVNNLVRTLRTHKFQIQNFKCSFCSPCNNLSNDVLITSICHKCQCHGVHLFECSYMYLTFSLVLVHF